MRWYLIDVKVFSDDKCGSFFVRAGELSLKGTVGRLAPR